METAYISNDIDLPDMETVYETMKYKYDIIDDTIDYISESKDEKSGMSFLSKVKIAGENLRRSMLKAKDKDKQLSMKLDSELNRTMKSAKKAMISDSRESIIRGSFLPSASKCIHLALAGGVVALFSPVAAVIALIGFIGSSKVLTEKERNLILDDIDIEIKDNTIKSKKGTSSYLRPGRTGIARIKVKQKKLMSYVLEKINLLD